MESTTVNVPLRSGGKKMRKRRELDALVIAKRQNKKYQTGNGINSQDQLLSQSTDEQEDLEWPKVTSTSNRNHNHKKCVFTKFCAPFILLIWALSFCFMYWLYFDLRQQLYEYRQKVEQVSVTSQNLPGALQKWHETTKFLEENQTIIFEKIQALQKSFLDMQNNLTVLKMKINDKKDSSNNEKYVADFGAQIRAMSDDVDSVKEKITQYQAYKTDINHEIESIKNNISNLIVPGSNNQTFINCSEEINQLKDKVFNDVKSLKFNITSVNDTLSQKTKNLNDELVLHKHQIDIFLDRSENATSHVKSIEDDWTKHKDILLNWNSNQITFNSEISNLKNVSAHLQNSIQEINENLNKFQNEVDKNFLQIKQKEAKNEMDNLVNNTIAVKNDIKNIDIDNKLNDLLKNPNATSNNQEQKTKILKTTNDVLPIVNQTDSLVVNMR